MDNEKITRIAEAIVKSMQVSNPETAKFGLEKARLLISKVEKKAAEMGLSVVVAVSNEAARPIAVECMDDSYIASYDVALNKAFTAVALKMSTRTLGTLAAPGASLYGIQHTNEGKIVIFGGGEPLRYNGKIIGGLGVSGGSEEEDSCLSSYGASIIDEIMMNG
ncbi:MAG: heme-binding protein [Clostridia bacterium]|nr:heme-binding protein [Clostridia bacterium]